jgi:UDP-galactopyranose mutase
MHKSNKEIIERAQAEIIERGDNPYYPVEQHLKDTDLIADLEELKLKYA